MDIDIIKNNFIEAKEILESFINDENNWKLLDAAAEKIANAFTDGNKVISCGNGGSMGDAMHFAEEFTGRFRDDRISLPAIAISDPTYITCTANDYGYNEIFSRYVQSMGIKGDILLAISTSGNSFNVIKAVETAKSKGIFIIALTGKDGGKLANICDIELRVPNTKYADRVQEMHIKIIHSLIHLVEKKLKL